MSVPPTGMDVNKLMPLDKGQLTAEQCRMARAALQWSQTDLASAANLRQETVSNFESGHEARVSTSRAIRAVFEAQGVIFISAGEASLTGDVGVRLCPKHS